MPTCPILCHVCNTESRDRSLIGLRPTPHKRALLRAILVPAITQAHTKELQRTSESLCWHTNTY